MSHSEAYATDVAGTRPNPDAARESPQAAPVQAPSAADRSQAGPVPDAGRGLGQSVRALHPRRPFVDLYQRHVPQALQADKGYVETRVEQIYQLSRLWVEDYSVDVLTHPKVGPALSGLEHRLRPDAAPTIVKRLCDMLLFTSLVATGPSSGRSIHVLTPDSLVREIEVLSPAGDVQSRSTDSASEKARDDPRHALLQEMLKVNLLSLDGDLRGRVEGSALFKLIAASNVIDVILFASTSSEEQHYLSTCTVAAYDQEILAKIGSLASLVVVGRAVAQRLHGDLGVKRAGLENQAALQGANLFQHATDQIRASELDFDDIETEAATLVTGSVRDVAKYAALIARWGKAMQRISAVVNVPVEGEKEGIEAVSILSRKIVPGQWVVSALLMAAPVLARAGGSGEFVAYMEGRMRPPNVGEYGRTLRQAGVRASRWDEHDNPVPGQKSKAEWLGAIDKLWSEVFFRGSLAFSIPGHALAMKATKMGGEPRFLLNDPKGSTYEQMSKQAMVAYLSGYAVDMPFNPF
jgi:hypothetical protein